MKGSKDLCFLRKLVESTCKSSLEFEMSGEKFEISAKTETIVLMHTESGEGIETNSIHRLADFIHNSSPKYSQYQQPVDTDTYIMVIVEVMKVALSDKVGMVRQGVETLIGSMAEREPEDVEKYLRILKGIK